MDQIVQFMPRKDIEATKNVAAFIDMCRTQLATFGQDLDFESNNWDVGNYLESRGTNNHRSTLLFSNHDTNVQSKNRWVYMTEPFLSFAKAYIRYSYALRPTKSIFTKILALRALERAISENGMPSNIEAATAENFNRAAALLGNKYGSSSSYGAGKELELIAKFCTENNLVSKPVQWKNPLRLNYSLNSKIGIDAEKHRKQKLPSKAALEALPKTFWLAKETPDVIVTSATAIFCGSPNRISELLTLPVDCEVERDFDGKRLYGLRWWPAKGAEPMIKWIIPSMVDVVKEAIRRIRSHTDEARRIAKWYEDYPDKIYLSPGMDRLRHQEFLTPQELAEILGVSDSCAWCKRRSIKFHENGFRFKDVEDQVLYMLPRNFPVLAQETGLKYSEALFVIRLHEISEAFGVCRCVCAPVSIQQINHGLALSVGSQRTSVFSRMDFTEPDGSPIKVTTHQFRHWLNTMAQRGGMSQLDIAKWSGRVNVHHNKDYDHMTPDELLQKLRAIAGDEVNVAGLPLVMRERDPVAREEFIKMMIPAAHTSELGFCVHDWTFLPCQLHRDCINCSEHCYIKGDLKRESACRQALLEAEKQLEFAEQALVEECAGADRWVDHQRLSVEHLRNLVRIYDDPNCPNGAMIRLATPEPPSRIRFAIEERKALETTIGTISHSVP